MPRHVWLCTRPLGYGLPAMEVTSDPSRLYLRHWGVLVSELSVVDIQVIVHSISSINSGEVIGTVYHLMQYANQPEVFVDNQTTVEMLRTDWKLIHLEYVGETLLTHEMIMQEGITSPAF